MNHRNPPLKMKKTPLNFWIWWNFIMTVLVTATVTGNDLRWPVGGSIWTQKSSKYYKCLNKCNVFKYLWKPSKLTKNQDSLLSSIMNSCMNIWRVRMKFRYFCILLGRGFSSMVLQRELCQTLTKNKKPLNGESN